MNCFLSVAIRLGNALGYHALPASDLVSQAISPDGQKIVFAAMSDGRPMLWLRSLDSVVARSSVEVGTPAPLFVTRVGGAIALLRQQHVVSNDGQRFLMNAIVGETNSSPITVILNWQGERKK